MSNISKQKTTTEQLRFIDDLSAALLPWGMPTGVGRLYGYLLLQEQPVSLDEMCEELEIAKSTASVSARELERTQLVTRHSVRGSKRVLYSVSEGNTSLMHDKVAMLGYLASTLLKRQNVATNTTASTRLNDMAGYCLALQKVLANALDELETDWNSVARPDDTPKKQ
ncbi:hypothetical protein [Halioxenophilus sp. WMMB6]|uniref:GbsR/MarR family transcriptional regulator n=1 Tax=Halioxenophilus sp. WMMB6 TaxID=3073815 RepID=UPI00295F2146|nr:hypothetical protein [Halioxenophilus sp. WMMB6]